MKLGIDIDEVVVKFIEGFLKFYEKESNEKLEFKNLVDYRLWKTTNLSEEESFKKVYDFYDSILFDNLNLIEGVSEAIKELANKYEIVFITSRPNSISDKTENFLKKHFSDIKFKVIHSSEWASKNQGTKLKGDLCLEHNIDFMVEDMYDYALDCGSKGIKTFLLEKPWNKGMKEHDKIIKVKHWNEILEMLK